MALNDPLNNSNSVPSDVESNTARNTHIFHELTAQSMELNLKNKKDYKRPIKKGICNCRECDNPSGYPKKPNSLYCSARCQSRGLFKQRFYFIVLFIYVNRTKYKTRKS